MSSGANLFHGQDNVVWLQEMVFFIGKKRKKQIDCVVSSSF